MRAHLTYRDLMHTPQLATAALIMTVESRAPHRRWLFSYIFSSSLFLCSSTPASLTQGSRISSSLTRCTHLLRSLLPHSPSFKLFRQLRHHILEYLYPSQSARKYGTPTVLLMSQRFAVTSVTAPGSYALQFPYGESSDMRRVSRKMHDGFRAYQRNTGSRHPFAPNVKRSEKQRPGVEPLINYEFTYWYGSISVGSNPAKTFTGEFSRLKLYHLE
jgi:hypothetical protein